MSNVLLCKEIDLKALASLLARFGLSLEHVADGEPIPGSWFGDPEAGIIARRVLVRGDTPLHSALHESCHLICMDEARRAVLHTNAGGDYDEENAVNYMEITLASYLTDVGRGRIFADMDSWGYTFRLGSAQAWFEQDAEDARQWLLHHNLLHTDGSPTWNLRD
ncbi:MAG: hypothetical protein ABFS08_06335 [Pseudomonadota bacterium]